MICKGKEEVGGRKEKYELASGVAVSKLWRLAICIPLTSCVVVSKLYTVGELCGS